MDCAIVSFQTPIEQRNGDLAKLRKRKPNRFLDMADGALGRIARVLPLCLAIDCSGQSLLEIIHGPAQ